MSDAISTQLDLSRLPPPEAIVGLDLEGIIAARKTALVAHGPEYGIDFSVPSAEGDAANWHQRVDAFRELLAVAAVNDVYKATLVAFASGAALDHIAATLHFMARIEGESDDRFRRRVQYEAENKAGGRLTGYVAEALKASLDVYDVGAWVDRSVRYEPVVRLAVMVALDPDDDESDGTPPGALVQAVQAHMHREDVRQATDIIAVQPVTVTDVAVSVTIHHRPGPDPVVLRANALAALQAMAADRFHPHRDIPLSAIHAAASVAGVERVTINSPASDVVIDNGGLAHVSSIDVTSALTDG